MPTILFLGANPSDTTRLSLDDEVREIDMRLRGSPEGRRIHVEKEWAVRVTDIQGHLLRCRPGVVHFSGHGTRDGQLLVEDARGDSAPISKTAIGNLFGALPAPPCAVVLNACYSAEQALNIAEHIDCVVGMSTAIRDSAAIAFSGAFYRALGFGMSLQTAFELGRNQIELVHSSSQAEIPKLIVKKGTNPGDVYLRDAAP